MAEPTYELVMHAGPTPGKTFPVEKDDITIGRDLTNDIVINDAEVSRRHVRITREGDHFVIEDLGSTNGTFINGQRLSAPYQLRPGETITLGEHVTLTLEPNAFDADATIAAGSATATPGFPPTPPPAPEPPPAGPVTTPQPMMPPPPPPPMYAGSVPPQGPAVAVEPPVPPKRRSNLTWILIVVGILLLCICICVVVIYYVDSQNLYCNFLPSLCSSTGG